jgi:hypothetical protein
MTTFAEKKSPGRWRQAALLALVTVMCVRCGPAGSYITTPQTATTNNNSSPNANGAQESQVTQAKSFDSSGNWLFKAASSVNNIIFNFVQQDPQGFSQIVGQEQAPSGHSFFFSAQQSETEPTKYLGFAQDVNRTSGCSVVYAIEIDIELGTASGGATTQPVDGVTFQINSSNGACSVSKTVNTTYKLVPKT